MATAPMSAEPARIPWAKVRCATANPQLRPPKFQALTNSYFHQVAASAGKENIALTSFAAAATSSPARSLKKETAFHASDSQEHEKLADRQFGPKLNSSTTNEGGLEITGSQSSSSGGDAPSLQVTSLGGTEASLVLDMETLNCDEPMPSLVVNGSGTTNATSKSESVDGFSEDRFTRADSESELVPNRQVSTGRVSPPERRLHWTKRSLYDQMIAQV